MKIKAKSISYLAQRYIIRVLLLFTGLFSLSAQTITLSGIVKDENGAPLPNANIVAEPISNEALLFTISDERGRYQLSLTQGHEYYITISYLGYLTQKKQHLASRDSTIDIFLLPDTEQLKTVTLNYTPPVIIKKDTITYNVTSFTNGQERKLKDILKKLPAVEVDKNGNVMVQGKKVTKVLVEDKLFFTGSSKLAVDNIPADAVDKIEVLDNYSEVSFLKGLEDSDDMAMNIKLKEEKKKFIFGDIEAGIGASRQYLIHPTIYYYSPNTTVNVIADINDTGVRSFTMKDYLDFEGGVSTLLSDSRSYFSLYKNEISQFLRNQDFQQSTNQFGAINISQDFNSAFSLSSYGIFSKSKDETRSSTQNEYIGNDNLFELRTQDGVNRNSFGISKTELSYTPNKETDVSFESYLKYSNNNRFHNTETSSDVRNAIIKSNHQGTDFTFREYIQWHKRFNKNQTTSIVLNYEYKKTTPNLNWNTNQSILTGLIPIVEQDMLNIFNNKSTQSQLLHTTAKYYHILNDHHHLYLQAGNNYSYDAFNTFEYQLLDDGTINSFNESGFGNQTRINFNDFFVGAEYKFKRNIITLKAGMFYHLYSLNTNQLLNQNKLTKGALLPEFSARVDFSSSKKLSLNYKRRVLFPTAPQLSNRFTLINFNNIYRGDITLQNQSYHNSSLSFHRFSLYHDLIYSISINFRTSDRNIKNATSISGIDYVSTPILLNNEDTSWRLNGSFRKGLGRFELSCKTDIGLANYVRPINNELVKASSNTYSFTTSAKTKFKDIPNIEVGIEKSFSDYRSLRDAKFENTVLAGRIECDTFKNLSVSFDYEHETYNNKTLDNINSFDIANASVRYQRENNPWGFEITATNIFDVRFKRRNTFSTLLISDTQTFILPRIVMFKILYKL